MIKRIRFWSLKTRGDSVSHIARVGVVIVCQCFTTSFKVVRSGTRIRKFANRLSKQKMLESFGRQSFNLQLVDS